MKRGSATKNEVNEQVTPLLKKRRVHTMFKHIFATMHQLLDEITVQYPSAALDKKKELGEQLELLKSMSDAFIEEWLGFEEKLGQAKWGGHPQVEPQLHKMVPQHATTTIAETMEKGSGKEAHPVSFAKGQGYYQLMMYQEAIRELLQVVWLHPEHMIARLYLAMSYMQVDDTSEAFRHFQIIIPLTEDSTIKAIAYNALGCLQVKDDNMERAREMFQLAHETDPSLAEPMLNMEICKLGEGPHPIGS